MTSLLKEEVKALLCPSEFHFDMNKHKSALIMQSCTTLFKNPGGETWRCIFSRFWKPDRPQSVSALLTQLAPVWWIYAMTAKRRQSRVESSFLLHCVNPPTRRKRNIKTSLAENYRITTSQRCPQVLNNE